MRRDNHSSKARGRALCMLQLPGTINHFCFWLLHCSRIVPLSLSKGRLDLRMTSNGFKWGCAQFSPVADWMSNVHLFPEDEGQQYGKRPQSLGPLLSAWRCGLVTTGKRQVD